MTIDIKDASNNVTEMYNQLKPIVDSVVAKNAKNIDDIIKKIRKDLSSLTNSDLQNYMLQLSIETYYFSQIKDMSALKQECALALLNESKADVYNSSEGTQGYRSNQAIIQTLDKQAVNLLYTAVSSNMKSKLDEAHRMVNILSNVLISKNAEAKLKGVRDDLHNYDDSEDRNG